MSIDSEQQRKFVGLIVRLQTRLRAYIISLMPGDSDVSDVLQETNIILWEKMDSFKPDSNFTAWAFSIARLEVFAHCRKQKRRSQLASNPDLAESIAKQISIDFEKGDEVMESRIKALKICLSTLTPEERELIRARYSEHTSLAEYARNTNRSDSSLRSIILRTRTALRKCISVKLSQMS